MPKFPSIPRCWVDGFAFQPLTAMSMFASRAERSQERRWFLEDVVSKGSITRRLETCSLDSVFKCLGAFARLSRPQVLV